MRSSFRIVVVLLGFLLAGCATMAPKQPASELDRDRLWKQQLLANSNLSGWVLKGKIGVISGNKGGTATLAWAYQDDNQEIELYGPFGGGRVQIFVKNNRAILKDTKGAVIEGETADQVLYQRLGWKVPFTELIMWSRGLPNDDATEIEIDELGRLKSLNQGIWHVEYQEYRSVDNLVLPRKLIITSLSGAVEIYDNEGEYIGDELSVKIILKRWWDITTH